MTASINASTSSGVIVTSDTSGSLALQTANTTAMTINSSQVVNFANTPTIAGSAFPSGAMTLISTQTVSASSALAFTGLATYDKYVLILENIYTSTSDSIFLQTGTGSSPTYITSGYLYSGIQLAASASSNNSPFAIDIYNLGASNGIPLFTSTNSGNTGGVGNITLTGFLSNYLTLTGTTGFTRNSGGILMYSAHIAGTNQSSGTTTALKIIPNSGTLTGSASLYSISS
jgi:hypothetical protein